ncbi:MAG: (2Fe-2S) ferredoxin domain-containing protein [Rhodospirillales bacterium]|nr:(2Fe-2S) ferredoxin domain-containing protein [Rhodospirillales bacterium]
MVMTNPVKIYVCTNLQFSSRSCSGQGAFEVLKALRAQPEVKDGTVSVLESVCMGYCGDGPNVKIIGGGFYHAVKPSDAVGLVAAAMAQQMSKSPVKH